MKDIKIILIAASFAFIVSLISGLTGSVSFGVLVFRALAGGIIFGLAAFGLSYIARRYLPELYEIKNDYSSSDEDLPEDAETESGFHDEAPESGVSIKPSIDISIDDEDEAGESAIDTGYGDEEPEEAESADLVEEISPVQQTSSDESLDSLPDMDVFSGSFSGFSNDTEGLDPVGGPESVDIMGDEQSPEVVAKAVRTIMKKDQEG